MSALTISADEEKRLKGQGFLNNKGTDNFSARVLTVNGKVTAARAAVPGGGGGAVRQRESDLYYPTDRRGTGHPL